MIHSFNRRNLNEVNSGMNCRDWISLWLSKFT